MNNYIYSVAIKYITLAEALARASASSKRDSGKMCITSSK